MKDIFTYLFDHIVGLRVRKNFFWGPVFGLTWFMIFTLASDFIAQLVEPQLTWFSLDEEVRTNVVTSLTLTAFYLVFGMTLIYLRRIHRSFMAWVLFLLAVSFAFFRFTHIFCAIAVALMSMLRGSNPFDPQLRERAVYGEEVKARASCPPMDRRRKHEALQRHRSHNVATEHPVIPAERAVYTSREDDEADPEAGKRKDSA